MKYVVVSILVGHQRLMLCPIAAEADTTLSNKFVSDIARFSIRYPDSWELVPSEMNEVWMAEGDVSAKLVRCFVRKRAVPGWTSVSAEDFVGTMKRDQVLGMLSIGVEDPKINLFDTFFLGGRKAMRIIYFGIIGGVDVSSYMLQTVSRNEIVTAGCLSLRSDFLVAFPVFDIVTRSLIFLPGF
jgi:hypothetical protein